MAKASAAPTPPLPTLYHPLTAVEPAAQATLDAVEAASSCWVISAVNKTKSGKGDREWLAAILDDYVTEIGKASLKR